MMTPEEIRLLGDEVCDFMEEMYGPLQSSVVYNVFLALCDGHYVWSPGRYFACYWKVHPDDVQRVMNREKPLDISHGTVMYVSEAASKSGLAEVIKELRKQAVGMKGLFWHRPSKKDKVYLFPSQEGEGGEDGITG